MLPTADQPLRDARLADPRADRAGGMRSRLPSDPVLPHAQAGARARARAPGGARIGLAMTAWLAGASGAFAGAADLSAGAPPAASAGAQAVDPSAAVVAEGHYRYRQRDLDALLLVARRYARGHLSDADADRLRTILIRAFVAREPLIDDLGGLPTSLAGPARDQLVLDILAYQAPPSLRPPSAPPDPAMAPASSVAPGPVLVRLPLLTVTRTIAGLDRRLSLGLAVAVGDQALNARLEMQAPLIQDAILGYVDRLPDAQFIDPDQLTLKAGMTAAIRAAVPEFPAHGLLIPTLDAGPAVAAGAIPPPAAGR